MRIFEGRGAASHLPDALGTATRVLVVHLDEAYAECGAKAIVDHACSGREVATFTGFPCNPRIEDAIQGMQVARELRPEIVLAVGGGSVMDMAKVLALFATHPDSDLIGLAVGREHVDKDALPIVALPTTAGTGSESTQFAVVYYEGKKYSLSHPSLLPTVAIVEPAFCDSLPPLVTACSGLDVICQAIEAMWSVNATVESDTEAERGLQLALDNIVAAVDRGSAGARDAMSQAATAAGRAINITRTTAPHALSYWLTSHRNVPHGHAVALTLPAVLTFNALTTTEDVTDKRGVEFVHSKLQRIYQLLSATDATDASERLDQLIAKLGLSNRLADVGIQADDIESMAQSVNTQRLANNPRRMTHDQIVQLLNSIL